MKFIKIIAVIGILCMTVLSACDKNNINNSPSGYTYVQSSDGENTSSESPDNIRKDFAVNNSWHENFSVTYSYFNAAQNTPDMKIREKKTSDAFTVEYVDTDSILYYKANGSDTDYYVIVEGQDQQAHSVLENKSFSSLSSLFMKLSEVDEKLNSQSNVLYMSDETVGGRNCHKYIQRAYKDGNLTETVYIWVDVQYGFAAKCEAYDASDNLNIKWEIESFETGSVTDDEVKIDLSKYTFTEQIE